MEIKNMYFFNAQGTVARWIDSAVLFIASFLCFSIYYYIEFEVCVGPICEQLFITAFWYKNSAIYLACGIFLIPVNFYIFSAKEMIRLYSLSIMMFSSLSVISLGLIFFAMLRELKTLA